MKSNRWPVFQVVALAFLAGLVSCAAQQSDSPAAPIAPGTVEPVGTRGIGSFQGPVQNANGETQAILTIDVWEKDGQTNAQLTLSPSGATSVIPLDAGAESFDVELPAQTFGNSVSVKGEWNGSAWVGRIASTSSGAAVNSFVLAQGASTKAAVAVGTPSGIFDGVLTYKGSGRKYSVALILDSSSDLGDALASTLVSRVSLNASFKHADGSLEKLTNVVWDREASTFTADGTTRTSYGFSAFRCKMSEMNSGDKDVLQCTYTMSESKAQVATGALSQKRAVVAPPYAPTPVPAPTATPIPAPTAIPVPAPTPSVVTKTSRVYAGAGVFTNERGQTQTRTLTLTVTLTAEPTGADQEAVVKFIVDGSRVGAKFTDGSYNSSTGELRAKELLTLGPIAGALKLACGGVRFADPRYDFICRYESSVTNVTGEFHLKGTQD
jgi:hypothetical protein